MARPLDGPFDLAEIERFLETFMYHEDVFLVDEVVRMDAEQRSIEALLDRRAHLSDCRWDRSANRERTCPASVPPPSV